VPIATFSEPAAQSFGAMALKAAARALARNKLRSALTMLGIFIGVAALIAMVAVGQGANQAVKAQIASLGTNLLIVLPGAVTSSGVRAGYGSRSTLTAEDAEAIRKEDSRGADGQLSRSANGASRKQQSKLEHQCSGRDALVSADSQLADRVRTRADPGRRARRFVGLPARKYGVKNLFGEHQDPVGSIIRVKNVECAWSAF